MPIYSANPPSHCFLVFVWWYFVCKGGDFLRFCGSYFGEFVCWFISTNVAVSWNPLECNMNSMGSDQVAYPLCNFWCNLILVGWILEGFECRFWVAENDDICWITFWEFKSLVGQLHGEVDCKETDWSTLKTEHRRIWYRPAPLH